MHKNSLQQGLHAALIEFMTNSSAWDDILLQELPKSWENFNGFILFSYPSFQSDKWLKCGPGLWELICTYLKGHSIALKGRISSDGFRTPQAKLIFGNSCIVNYIDNGIKYSWNVERNMFSVGNVSERHRIAKYDCHGEEIVDLFAGIGYFTLPYLLHAMAKFVHACEWNPDAVECLRRNLHLNKVEKRCKLYTGDNRQVCPKKVANRVNLGLIPSSEPFWGVACGALVDTGGILYVHNNVTSKIVPQDICNICEDLKSRLELNMSKNMLISNITFKIENDMDFVFTAGDNSLKWKHPEWFEFSIHICHKILSHLKGMYSNSWCVSITEVFKVKSYAPHIDHLVYTVHCKPSEIM